MKKILGIVGSPRRNGNTHMLVSRILEGARDEGANVEIIFLQDLNIIECDGCYECSQGKHECSKDDDMIDLYPKIGDADAMVLGTPVYWFGPTAIMKGFIDRFTYFCCPAKREIIRNKPVVIAVPFADRKYQTADLVVEFFTKSLDYLEMRLIEKVLVPGVAEPGEVGTKKRVMARCYKLGQRMAKAARVSPAG